MPETQRRPTLASYASGNGYFYFGVAIAIAVIIVGAIFNGYAANLRGTVDELDGKLQATENARNRDQERILIDAQQQSRLMRSLLTGKIYWTQALGRMEAMMQSSVALTRMDASLTKGTITFSAVADSYATVARQLKAFSQGTGVSDITVSSVKSEAPGQVEFEGELIIDTKTMLNKSVSSQP